MSWWKPWTWRRAKRQFAGAAVREFIYLDEISVISMLAARSGAVTEQIQEGSTREEQLQTDSTAGVNAKALKAESKSSFQTKNSQSVQTTRKANIQSQFKTFYEDAKKERLLFPGESPRKEVRSVEKLLESDGLCRSERDLNRGDIVDFTVILRADPIYRMGAMIAEFVGMSDDHPEVFGTIQGSMTSEMRSYGKLLERFMTGLVPVKAVVKDVRLLQHRGNRYLVQASTADRLGLSTSEIQLVGVSEKDSYWKDMRRVLFSDQEVRVLARINDKTIKGAWSPVKLVDLFEGTIPGLGQQFSMLAGMALQQPADQSNRYAELFKRALILFAEDVANRQTFSLSSTQTADIETLAESLKYQVGTQEAQRSAFRQVQEKLVVFGMAPIEPAEAARLRRQARNRASLPLFMDTSSAQLLPTQSGANGSERLLEVEIVAMYW
ncbi:DUF6414 family protein [Nocardia otitidiscaviarum]|uniref:DUF6414 family protein n=1 Tax=Nocardia otitidiscaviarum TaxID=1823 RepID=UPI001894B6AD|nr:hypothetical protein [Nocardia otitidiscaviarum]MBF6177716.1 hypothetical protein [Nocardia otitidiscaviarum]